MPRARRGEWGVQFPIKVHRGGYEWVEIPAPKGGGARMVEVLAPVGMWKSDGPNRLVARGGVSVTETRSDLRGARLAINAFRKLARQVIEATTWDAIEVRGDGPQVFFRGDDVVDLAAAAIRNRRLINEFANRFGLLRGGNQRDLMTLDEWIKELKTFDDMMVISKAAHRLGDTGTFVARVHRDASGIFYSGPQLRREAIARVGERLELDDGAERIPHDLLDDATRGSDRDRARVLFSRLINHRLHGGLSFGVSTLNLEQASVIPTNLQSLIYVRLWLDTIDWDDARPVTHCQSPKCRKPLQGRRDKRFCDMACRNEWHNARRHRARSES